MRGRRPVGVVIARAHVDGRVDDALVGDLEGALDLAVDEVADGARRRREPLLRQVSPQRQLSRGNLNRALLFTLYFYRLASPFPP